MFIRGQSFIILGTGGRVTSGEGMETVQSKIMGMGLSEEFFTVVL